MRTGSWRSMGLVLMLGLSCAGCLGYDGDLNRGYLIDSASLEQIRAGASAEQVLVVLGTPSTTSTVGGDAWYYISQKTSKTFAFQDPTVVEQRILAVYFDNRKKVTRIANYGLEDGKVIDFISRTTPTGGNEQSFLTNAFKNLLRF
jgi:outer membrane protein assembly factor BamE (lipoprotein component of BamABCDE complex)